MFSFIRVGRCHCYPGARNFDRSTSNGIAFRSIDNFYQYFWLKLRVGCYMVLHLGFAYKVRVSGVSDSVTLVRVASVQVLVKAGH